jgi:hypothetical protein
MADNFTRPKLPASPLWSSVQLLAWIVLCSWLVLLRWIWNFAFYPHQPAFFELQVKGGISPPFVPLTFALTSNHVA